MDLIHNETESKLLVSHPPRIERLKANKFLVRLPNDKPLIGWAFDEIVKPKYDMVKNDWEEKVLTAKVVRFVNEDSDETLENTLSTASDLGIIELCRKFNADKIDSITIEYLDPCGCVVHGTKYTNPTVLSVDFEKCEHKSDSFLTIGLKIGFDEAIDC